MNRLPELYHSAQMNLLHTLEAQKSLRVYLPVQQAPSFLSFSQISKKFFFLMSAYWNHRDKREISR